MMSNKIIYLLSFTILLISASIGDWKEFKSFDGGFRVIVPGEMIEKVKTIETAIGLLEYHTFIYQEEDSEADNVLYMVSYCDYPDHSIHSDSTELLNDFFKNTIESSVQSIDGELAYNTSVNLYEYPGRLWRINYNGGKAIIKTKAFLVNQRYYSIQGVTFRTKSLNPSMDRFLDSFKLLTKKEDIQEK